MTKTRLEAFSDGVIAILITIMVLELKIPHGTSWEAVRPLIPTLVSYVLSFVIIAIYWGNHHHLLHTISHVNSKLIWANNHLLFWISLVPFATAWMGENNFDKITVVVYAAVLNLCGFAYSILLNVVTSLLPDDPRLLIPIEKQTKKGVMSLILYSAAIGAAFIHTAISGGLFVLVAIMWLIPDRNIENSLKGKP